MKKNLLNFSYDLVTVEFQLQKVYIRQRRGSNFCLPVQQVGGYRFTDFIELNWNNRRF